MHIDYLAEHVELVPSIAQWQLGEWGHLTDSDSLDARIAMLNDRLNRDRVPLVLVALSGSAPIGTVSLLDNDLAARPQLRPWLAQLFVPEELRRQGIGTALVHRGIEEAWKLDFDHLYSVTWDHESLAKSSGWELVEHVDTAGKRAAVMRISRRVGHGSAP
ncbi:MAG: GNAT family N-acetyltransferase [Acidobacteriota bacterium]|nr:GNAT family N-acetyltransferase [Acidobacteriota bacterium]